MFLVKIFSVVLICGLVQCQLEGNHETNHEKASSYVRKVLEDFNRKSSATHDVVLLRLSVYKRLERQVDEIYESMIHAIPKENPVMMPRLSDMSKTKDTRKAAVIIIVSDVDDTVSLLLNQIKIVTVDSCILYHLLRSLIIKFMVPLTNQFYFQNSADTCGKTKADTDGSILEQ